MQDPPIGQYKPEEMPVLVREVLQHLRKAYPRTEVAGHLPMELHGHSSEVWSSLVPVIAKTLKEYYVESNLNQNMTAVRSGNFASSGTAGMSQCSFSYSLLTV